jgi:hypothetical protein
MKFRSFLSSDFVRIAFKRFPEALACAALATFICCGIIAKIIEDPDALTGHVLYLCCAGFVWFLILRITAEAHGFDFTKSRLLALSGFAAFSCFVIITHPPATSLFTLVGSLSLFLLVAPSLGRETRNASFWGFCHDLSRSLFFAVVLGLLFCLGVWLIELSLKYLFSLELGDHFMLYIWTITHGFVVPAYFLARLPAHYNYSEGCELPKDVRIISNYVCIPFVWIYLLILYVYIAKIGALGKLPSGQLGWMISIFGIAGILTHLTAYPLRETGNALARSYYRWFYPALLIPIGLLAVALYSRIEPYGITGARYLMILICVWFTVLAIYFTYRRRNGQLRIVPLTLAILLMATSFGPLGIVEYPIRSQMARLTGLLEKNQLLENGTLVKAKETPSLKDRREITSIVDYLTSVSGYRENDPSPLTQFVGNMANTAAQDESSSSSVRDLFFKRVGFQPVNAWNYERREEPLAKQNFSVDSNTPLAIGGYDMMLPVSLYSTTEPTRFSHAGKDYALMWRESGDLELTREATGEKALIPLLPLANERLKDPLVDETTYSITLNAPTLWFTGESDNIKIALQVNSLLTERQKKGEKNNYKINSFSGFFFMQEKP